MNDIEKAIKAIKEGDCGDGECLLWNIEMEDCPEQYGCHELCKKCHYGVILQALQEKADREKYESLSADCNICKQITEDCEKGNGCTGFCVLKVSGLNNKERQRMWELINKYVHEHIDRENPKPLTLEQLREREGKPVYLITTSKVGYWGIVRTALVYGDENNICIVCDRNFTFTLDNIEVYDHEPKGVN